MVWKSNKSPDQTRFGRYKITSANSTGNKLATKTEHYRKAKATPIRGTNNAFKKSDQPDTYPK